MGGVLYHGGTGFGTGMGYLFVGHIFILNSLMPMEIRMNLTGHLLFHGINISKWNTSAELVRKQP